MTDPKATLLKLNQNLNILREREAKYAGSAPLDLLNQISDHQQALDLTRQAITGELDKAEWREALKPLLLACQDGQVVNIEAETYVAGDVKGDLVAGDKVLGDKIITVTYEALPPAEARNRADLNILLKNVETTWIKGVLEHSVHEAALLDLGIETRADAVDHPWNMVLEAPDQSGHVLPKAKKIKAIFDEVNQLLLILGEPGAGKTTTLLQLARALIADVDPAFTRPVPVIFNLSTWTDKQQPLAEWLIAELNSKYRTPKKLGLRWLEERRILPLFDGLDEVRTENQAACVERINRLAVDYGFQGMVVCSRIKDYMALDVRLQFNSAIYLQPLTTAQIDDYIGRTGEKLVGLHGALKRDEALQSLAQAPLMLNIMSLAYQDRSAEELSNPELATDAVRRRHLFDTYIARMFKRKGDRRLYDAEYIKTRLAWLARNMQRHNQDVFLIEGLQPGWLPARRWRVGYVLASRMLGVLLGGLFVTLFSGLFGGLSNGFIIGLMGGDLSAGLTPGLYTGLFLVIGGLLTGVITGPSVGLTIGFIDSTRFEWWGRRVNRTVVSPLWWSIINVTLVGLLVGLIFGILSGLSAWLFNRLMSEFFGGSNPDSIIPLSEGVFEGLSLALTFGLIFGLRGSRQSLMNDIQTVEILRWSWSKASKGGPLGALIGGMIGGLYVLSGLLAELGGEGMEPSEGLMFGLVVGLIFGIVGALNGGLIGAVFNGLNGEIVETKTRPNQGIRLSVRNSIFGGMVVVLTVGLVAGVTLGLMNGLSIGLGIGMAMGAEMGLRQGLTQGLLNGLSTGLDFWLFGVLWYGGLDVIQHYTLRLILVIQGHTPRHYAQFLDHASDLIFLQKVGGGYRFIHRLLLEHFAEMNIERK